MSKKRRTTKDIAEILKARNSDGKYDAIIQRAELNGYHDFKHDKVKDHPEYGDCACPKAQLLEDLQPFPELNDIADDVVNGKYDESMDAEDIKDMRNELLEQNAPAGFFEILGLEPPTYAERIKHYLPQN